MLIKILLVLIWGFTVSHTQDATAGTACTVERTQSPGTCKLLEDCPAVIEDYRKRRKHTRCGFQEMQEIVCCPQEITNVLTEDSGRVSITKVHEKKCHEYQSAVYESVYSIGLAIGSERLKVQVDNCASPVLPLIVGGEFAKPAEFPHMAMIGFETAPNSGSSSWSCGGALISNRYVVTAAHCQISPKYGEAKYVRLGELDVRSMNEDASPEDYNILEFISHPNYSKFSKYDDIALVKLDKDVTFNKYHRPACLPSTFDSSGLKSIATGWGHTEHRGTVSPRLQKVVLEKFPQTECYEIYSNLSNDRRLSNGIVEISQICAGSKNASKDTCQGDSGGPLQVYHSNEYCMYTIIGVTSFGYQCGVIGVPGIYTRVYNYIDWIENVVWPGEKV